MKEAYLPFWVSSATLRSHLHRCPPSNPASCIRNTAGTRLVTVMSCQTWSVAIEILC